ncbi:NAD(P)-dependent oxidoreductase [Terrimonas sp.]|uniref:SDR family NAD(P)-dependent oxidoreductase n=1 Tax=Terrimonas sp. TaxID=1914338 RepID=UPI000D522FD5|nr:SDR family NAD(P)-dependent oxidoreductase [Terrimonas sp.]PVD53498.1 NAD(P)-dependent oxidoreductase [Terrimonas sp.]
MSKIVFITGATSGFGKACAEKFAKEGYNVIINGRREDRLQSLKTALEKQYGVNVLTLAFDVRNRNDVFEKINAIDEPWKKINILINNAGLALGREHIDEGNIDEWDTMMDTNVKGLLYVSKAVIPFLIPTRGHIINLGSVAGKEVYDKGNVYCASKFAVDAISKGMRIDLLRHGIKVTSINPGAAETEFSLVRFNGDEEKAKSVYNGLQPLTGPDVADVIYYCTTLPAHVCINDLVLCPTQQADAIYFNRK